ncbi:MAG: hypothetical protein DELT_02485 [Desulfovibrio sp.]
MKPIIIFSRQPKTPDLRSPYIHPPLKDAANSNVIVSVQENDLLRVAVYGDWFRMHMRHFRNDTDKDFTGIPAGYKRVPGSDNKIFFGDMPFTPQVLASKPIGTSEWPNNMLWRHVWKNYYFVTIYRYDSVIVEDLFVDRDGKDLLPVMGESNEKPGERPFTASWMGGKVAVTPVVLKGEELQIYYLQSVRERDLPPDFPEGLVKWVP